MKKIVSMGIVIGVAVVSASATVIYSTDFTSSDGFSDGGGINNTDGWKSQAGVYSTNVTASTGEARFTGNFLRGYQNTAIDMDALSAGDYVKMTVSFSALGTATQTGWDPNVFKMGLDYNTDLGSADPKAGLLIGYEGGGGAGQTWDLSSQSDGSRVDTGVATDNVWRDIVITVTKSATVGQLDVSSSFAGSTINYTVTDAGLYSTNAAFMMVMSQGQSNIGGVSLDSVQVEVIPEPATLGLIAAFGGSILFIRRRFMM